MDPTSTGRIAQKQKDTRDLPRCSWLLREGLWISGSPRAGISTSDQPSSQKVRNLIQEIKALGVKAIFAENIENPKVLQQITIETGANLGGTLYADGLGVGEAGTYIGMMKSNVTAIVGALQ